MKNLLTDICGPGGGLHKFKQLPGLILCGQKFGQVCQKQLDERKSSNGQSRNRSSTMREKLRGIYSIDPDGNEFMETIAQKKLELPTEVAMLCKLKTTKSSFRHRET